jgi:hypothetical protein
MSLNQPGGVVGIAECQQRLAEVFDGFVSPYPEQVFLQRADEAFVSTIAFRGTDQGRRALDARKAISF